MPKRNLEVRRLGRFGYAEGLALQKELEKDVIAGDAANHLLLLEHPHTFTLGRRSKNDGVLATAEMLRKLGVEVFEINRGGKITYHGIGQIVGYPVINLSPDREDVHRYVRDLRKIDSFDGRLRDRCFSDRRPDGRTHGRRQDRGDRRSYKTMGHNSRFRAERKHRS